MTIFGMVNTAGSQVFTHHALKTFFSNTRLNQEDKFYLIDNDLSLSHKDFCDYDLINIKNSEPLSFASNANQMIEKASALKADLIFLNNDLIFPKNWINPLLVNKPNILSPVTNREVQYPRPEKQQNAFGTRMNMELAEYLGYEKDFEIIAELHQKKHSGYLEVLVLPFCCVKIPYPVFKEVGYFDENFGLAGAEDYDYSLRTSLAGFQTEYAMSSYVLHFGGKSSWSGVENKEQTIQRELKFRQAFLTKWGQRLYDLIINEVDTSLQNTEISRFVAEKNYKAVINLLRNPDFDISTKYAD